MGSLEGSYLRSLELISFAHGGKVLARSPARAHFVLCSVSIVFFVSNAWYFVVLSLRPVGGLALTMTFSSYNIELTLIPSNFSVNNGAKRVAWYNV